MSFWKKLGATGIALAVLSAAGVAGAAVGGRLIRGAGPKAASLHCPGGMTRLGHVFSEDTPVFPGDPEIAISLAATIETDGFRVEAVQTGAHAGTHLDAPAHFIGGGRSVDELRADEFVWPVYKMDVRGQTFPDDPGTAQNEEGWIRVSDIRAYEAEHGRIPRGALVVLQTGAEEFWETGVFAFENAGFAGEAVEWLFDRRRIAGVGSDAYGPDAWSDDGSADPEDEDYGFNATFTALDKDGVALVALANLDSVNVRGDVILAPTIALQDGSGFTTDPLACHGSPRR
jgi:kynurenine formamidase